MTTTAIHWSSFSLHKDGNRPDEYEDAFAGNPKVGRFAVADGASESSFAALWAKLLVDGSTLPQPKTMSPMSLALNETISHPSATRSLTDFSTADQSIDLPNRVVFGMPENILYSN
jgi:hypothetical protein